MTVDDFLRIGKQHKICEDYVISGFIDNEIPYGIISDGCSSSKNTDTGARILCHLAKQYLFSRKKELGQLDVNEMGSWVIHNAEMSARHLGLDRTSLDATLIVSFVIENVVQMSMFGDGLIFLISELAPARTPIIEEINFIKNAPYYLSYEIDKERAKSYEEFKNKKRLQIKGSGGLTHIFDDYRTPYTASYSLDHYDFVIITSDGMNSFVENREPCEIEFIHYFRPFFDFQTVKGEFIKRQLGSKKGVLNSLEKIHEIYHFDDISVVGFHNFEV